MNIKNNEVSVTSLSKKDITISLIIIGSLFFVFGFISWANAILIPYFKIACELTHFESYLVAFAFYIAYFFMSVPSSYLLKKIGFKKGIMLAFWVMALGTFIFIPAAYSRTYGLFLTGLFIIGISLSILQTAANPYVTILGPLESAARRIGIMGIFNKGAGILAPLILGAVILKPTDDSLVNSLSTMSAVDKNIALDHIIQRVILPYTIITIALFILGLIIRFSPLPEIDTETEDKDLAIQNADKKSIFDFPHLILGAIAIFLHVGTQIIAVDTIISYANHQGLSLMQSKYFPSYTLLATIFGYFLGILLIPKYLSQLRVLQFCTILGLILSFGIAFSGGEKFTLFGYYADISLWLLVLLGFANSMVWAGIWPLAMKGLGRYIKLGASILIMGLCGNAILPIIYGHLADSYNIKIAYTVLIPCYAYLIFYAVKGYKIKNWR